MNTSSASLNRHRFLQRLAGAVATSFAAPIQAITVSGDLYINHRIGLSFRKVSAWRFEHPRTFQDIRNEYEYATADPDLLEDLKNGPLPVVVVAQGPLLTTLCASMTAHAEQNPLRPGETLAEAASDIVQGTSMFVKDFRLIDQPSLGKVDGRPALDFRFRFLYEDRLGHRGPVRHRSLLVLNGDILHTFHMLDIPADGIDAQDQFNAMVGSIILA